MTRLDNLPYVDQLAQIAVQIVERWICASALTPLSVGVLVVYVFFTCCRPVHA